MGDDEDRENFVLAVEKACRIAKMLEQARRAQVRRDPHRLRRAARRTGMPIPWQHQKIAATFREAAKVAKDHGERLAAEGEICWAGMHSWKAMLDLLEEVGMPETVGFQADHGPHLSLPAGLQRRGPRPAQGRLLRQAEFDAAYRR